MLIRLAWIALVLAAVATVLFCGLLALLWLNQERLLFHPQPLAVDARLSAEADVQESTVEVPGAKLSVLHLRLPQPKGVVFYLHGNAGNLSGWFTNTAFYREANYDLVMPDYRGYGKSTGRIESEAQLQDDMRLVWEHVAAQYAGKRVVIIGRSLGTALAAGLAPQVRADLTVLVTPYSSIRELAREIYPFVPAFLLRYPLETAERAKAIKGPILLLHGDRDSLIPLRHSERIAAALPNAKLQVVPGADHNDIHMHDVYRETLLKALRSL